MLDYESIITAVLLPKETIEKWFIEFLYGLSFQYSVYNCILALIACGVFLRVSLELKVAFLFIVSTISYIIIFYSQKDLFNIYSIQLFNNRYTLTNTSYICTQFINLY